MPARTSPETDTQTASGDVFVFFRPDQMAPPKDPSAATSFSFITGSGEMECYTFNAGPNKIAVSVWERVQKFPACQDMLSTNAFRVMTQEDRTKAIQNAEAEVTDDNINLAQLNMHEATTVVETSFDLEQLRQWESKEKRIPVKNALNRRITQITGGDA